MVRNLDIVKKPREDPIPDEPVVFPPLENLHLELIENKKKIKPGLPPVISQRKPPRAVIKPEVSSPPKQKESFEKAPIKAEKDIPEKEAPKVEKVSSKKVEKEPQKSSIKKPPPKEEIEDETLMLDELGEDDVDPVEMEIGEEEEVIEEEVIEEEEGEQENQDEEGEPAEDDPYAGLTPEERIAKEKEEYIWRFRIMKKRYKSPQIEIPTFNEHSDLQMMKTTYDRTVRELYLDDAVESYRTYLMGGFMVMEFVCTQWIGVDLSGFTMQQTRMMYKYDSLLIELGEKSYNRWGMNLPVEVRIIGLILLQAGIFYLGKIISTKYGNTIAELFKGITGQPPERYPQTSQSSEQPSSDKGSSAKASSKKRMRGPKIKPEDIRDIHSSS